VRLYAHRANLTGPGTGENKPESIRECLERGLGVEVDIWDHGGELWSGHERPQWKIDLQLLSHPGVICHAKHVTAAVALRSTTVSFFCLERDEFALCSNGLIWANYGCVPTAASIMCSPELVGETEPIEHFHTRVTEAHGICTDYPLRYLELITL